MPSIVPSKQWTLRLKNDTRTILLFADPAQTLISLKENLLHVLETAPVADPLAPKQPLPASAADIELAKPIDIFDLNQGWQLIGDDEDQDELAEPTKSKGKGKARVNGTTAEKSLASWGIKENYVLAWRVKSDDEDDETMGQDDGWNVVVPSYDDTYAEETGLPEAKD